MFEMIHPKAHCRILNISINGHNLQWQLLKVLSENGSFRALCYVSREHLWSIKTRQSEEAAGVNESSLYITGQLDKSMLGLCLFDMSKTAGKQAD